MHNLRDLGGHRSADGSTAPWPRLYRSVSLGKLTENDRVMFLADSPGDWSMYPPPGERRRARADRGLAQMWHRVPPRRGHPGPLPSPGRLSTACRGKPAPSAALATCVGWWWAC
ncbi:tyrosine-protein phosphatase [Streptomyces sp. NPDC051219]|uniref:tyrosine-protein phosphatase n=1 Tax=Streptomyces sp. NPDC051219 TaxID=3155283 RepID=UPI00343A0D36